MDSYDLLEAALRGEEIWRLPILLWRRFPRDDRDARSLAKAQLNFHRRFPSDILIVSPIYGYPALAYGAELESRWSPTGEREVRRPIIAEAEDWEALDELDVEEGMLAMAVEAVNLIADRLQGETPILQTIYSPLTICELIGGGRLKRDLDEEPEMVLEALRTIASTMAELSRASLDAGADGVFLIIRTAVGESLGEGEYRRRIAPYDRWILGSARGCLIRAIHLHGERLPLKLVAEEYPIEAMNWSGDRPTLVEAEVLFRGLILGGLDAERLKTLKPDEVEAMVGEIVDSISWGRLILAPNCALHLSTPEENLDSLLEAAAAYRPRIKHY